MAGKLFFILFSIAVSQWIYGRHLGGKKHLAFFASGRSFIILSTKSLCTKSFYVYIAPDFFVIGDFGLVEINKLADFKQGSLFRMGRLKNQNSISSVHDRLYKGRYIAVINSAETFFFICVNYLRNGWFNLNRFCFSIAKSLCSHINCIFMMQVSPEN